MTFCACPGQWEPSETVPAPPRLRRTVLYKFYYNYYYIMQLIDDIIEFIMR